MGFDYEDDYPEEFSREVCGFCGIELTGMVCPECLELFNHLTEQPVRTRWERLNMQGRIDRREFMPGTLKKARQNLRIQPKVRKAKEAVEAR